MGDFLEPESMKESLLCTKIIIEKIGLLPYGSEVVLTGPNVMSLKDTVGKNLSLRTDYLLPQNEIKMIVMLSPLPTELLNEVAEKAQEWKVPIIQGERSVLMNNPKILASHCLMYHLFPSVWKGFACF